MNPRTMEPKFELTKMDPTLYAQVSNLKDGEVTMPILDEARGSGKFYKIITVNNRTEEHQADFSKDFIKIKELALRDKQIKAIAHNCRLELIIIDEFQHLIERKSLKILKETANSIKSLIVETKIPMALFGMPYSSVILDSVSQLSSRFERRRTISPFHITTESELHTFRGFLSMFEKMFIPPPTLLWLRRVFPSLPTNHSKYCHQSHLCKGLIPPPISFTP